MKNDGDFLLTGLDGSNPLAFLAALGTLRTLCGKFPAAKLHWRIEGGKWTPVCSNCNVTLDSLPNILLELLPRDLGEPWNADKRLPFAAEKFRRLLLDQVEKQPCDEDVLAILAALGCEAVQDDKGQFADTAFRMVRSGDAAGQGFLDYACKIAARATAEDLAGCLLGTWKYEGSPSFRWDPMENREYALQAGDPSTDGAQGVVGANRLAIESLSLFPTQPGSGGMQTTGFWRPATRSGLEFRWPLWGIPLPIPVIRSLLTLPVLFGVRLDQARLSAAGILAVFASRQVRPNQYYRNFSPARTVL